MKKFLVIGNMNAITYKEVFPLIKDNKIWLGVRPATGGMWFTIDDETSCGTKKVVDGKLLGNTKSIWFTNLDHKKRHEPIDLYKRYTPEEFPKYDNYNAIEVSKVCDIPEDYKGIMGVPITFLDKYCPEQFEIVDARDYALKEELKHKATYLVKDADGSINGKAKYARILIKSK